MDGVARGPGVPGPLDACSRNIAQTRRTSSVAVSFCQQQAVQAVQAVRTLQTLQTLQPLQLHKKSPDSCRLSRLAAPPGWSALCSLPVSASLWASLRVCASARLTMTSHLLLLVARMSVGKGGRRERGRVPPTDYLSSTNSSTSCVLRPTVTDVRFVMFSCKVILIVFPSRRHLHDGC